MIGVYRCINPSTASNIAECRHRLTAASRWWGWYGPVYFWVPSDLFHWPQSSRVSLCGMTPRPAHIPLVNHLTSGSACTPTCLWCRGGSGEATFVAIYNKRLIVNWWHPCFISAEYHPALHTSTQLAVHCCTDAVYQHISIERWSDFKECDFITFVITLSQNCWFWLYETVATCDQ